jgi:hypothetical protein
MLDQYALEAVYAAIFLLGMAAAVLLARWTTKRLLVFMFCVAVLVLSAKAARVLLETSSSQYAPCLKSTPQFTVT